MTPNRINIALFMRNFGLGGTERQILELAKCLDRRKHNVFLIALRDSGELRTSFLSLPDLHIVVLDVTTPLGTLFKLVHVVQEAQIHVLQSFLVATNVYSLFLKLLKPRLKVLISIRDSTPDFCFGYSSLGWKLKMWALEVCTRCLSPVADLRVANSESGKAAYQDRFGIRSIVIPNGIDTEKFKLDEAARRRLRDLVGVSAQATLIGILANCTPHKDYPTFIRAAKQIVEKRQDLHFVSFGDNQLPAGKLAAELVNEFGLSPFFHFLGIREDVHKLLPGLDALCSSSITEGFPNAIAEAMACGVPCVVTDVGDSRNIVGDAGIVVPPQNPEALASGLMSQLDLDPFQREKLAAASRQRIVQNFGIASMTARHEQLYELILSRPSHEMDWLTTSA